MTKGKRRERQAAEIYERAGYETFRPQESKYGETDIFGLFDMVAVKPDEYTRWVQVKTNQPRGAEAWFNDGRELIGYGDALDYLICYDRSGWRLLKGDRTPFRTVVDEREMDCAMGDGLVDYLRGDNGEA